VHLWDVNRGEMTSELTEHKKRVWSANFSTLDPTRLVGHATNYPPRHLPALRTLVSVSVELSVTWRAISARLWSSNAFQSLDKP
jgi:hypothetical protein